MDKKVDSILDSIKKLLGIESEYTQFDIDVMLHINSVFSTLNQLGVGPKSGFRITGKDETWNDFISGDPAYYSFLKSYIYLRVKLLFDPPQNSFAVESINNQVKEMEWRITVEADHRKEEENQNE